MATNYPTNKDNFTKPQPTDEVSVVSHADQHADANDAIESLQNKVGIDGDANTDSFDYKLSTVTGVDKVAPKTATDNAISAVQQNLTDHENDTANPHSVNKTQVGLSNVTNDKQVALTGDQTIDGIKTFSSSPIVPTPSIDFEVATKKYVDDNTGDENDSTIRIGFGNYTTTVTHGLGQIPSYVEITVFDREHGGSPASNVTSYGFAVINTSTGARISGGSSYGLVFDSGSSEQLYAGTSTNNDFNFSNDTDTPLSGFVSSVTSTTITFSRYLPDYAIWKVTK